jgi:general secretion pathway protein D
MKVIPTILLLAAIGLGVSRAAEPAPEPEDNPSAAPAQTDPAEPGAAMASTNSAAPDIAGAMESADTNATAVPMALNATNCLRLNFRGASLESVLNYMSEAAGFIIVLEAQPRGKVDMWSSQPLTRDEAVDLLNSVLNRNGYAAIRKGRTLTIVNKDEAKTKAIPVRFGSDPAGMPETDEMVTQIIPVRFVEVAQLIKDLQPLVATQTAMTANESGNSIVITDTQSNIRRVAEVIKCIDSGAEDMTVVRVFKLKNSNPTEMADLLTSLFPDDSRSGGSQSPFQLGGPGGFRRMFGGGGPGGFGGGANQAASNSQNQRIKKRNRVIAVADQRTASVVVTATKDLVEQIENVVMELDGDKLNVKSVKVFALQHAEPQDAMQVLQDIFQKSGTQNNRQQTQNNALQSRSTTQIQQNNNNASRSGMGQGNRRSGFGQ